MKGFHAVKLWKSETFHCHNQMQIIIMQTLNGKEGSKLWRRFCCSGASYLAIEMNFVSVFRPFFRAILEASHGTSKPIAIP
jgi:hypothetical protein